MMNLKDYKLSDLYVLSSGISTKPNQAGHGFPFCSFSTIFNNEILPEEFNELMDTSILERETYSIKQGDVLITRTSETLDELAMSSVAVKDYDNATFSGFAKRLRPISEDAYPKYMAYFLRSEYFRQIINNKAIMTLRASFNENIFNDIHFMLPPLKYQKKVGDFLWDIESKIRLNYKMADNYKKIIKLNYDFWISNYGGNSNLVWNENLKMKIPYGWKSVKIIDLIDTFLGGDWGKDHQEKNNTLKVKCICGKDINSILEGKFDDLSTRYILEKNKNKILNCFDYVIEVSGTPGRSTYINSNLLDRYESPLIASNFCTAFSFKKKEDIYWFDELWRRLYKAGVAKGFSGKTTIANLLFDSLANSVYVAYPDEEYMSKYFNIVSPIYEKIQNLYTENLRLKKMRDYLIPLFIRGQIEIGEGE